MTRRYAEGTTVSVAASRGEISGILAKHGVVEMAWGTKPTGDDLAFALGSHRFAFWIPRPTLEEVRNRYIAEGGRWNLVYNPAEKVEQEWRRRWRAHVLLLKAKLEFIAAGDSTLERELMPFLLLHDGRTLEEALSAGALPALMPGTA